MFTNSQVTSIPYPSSQTNDNDFPFNYLSFLEQTETDPDFARRSVASNEQASSSAIISQTVTEDSLTSPALLSSNRHDEMHQQQAPKLSNPSTLTNFFQSFMETETEFAQPPEPPDGLPSYTASKPFKPKAYWESQSPANFDAFSN